MIDQPVERRLPYPGLRSFRREETDLFFGREASVNHMIRRLAASRFLAVLGASGSGKSSLVRTGLLDGLELGLLAQAGSWWRVIDIHPGGEPLRNLARGLCGNEADDTEVEQVRAFLLRGPRSIVEWSGSHLKEGENLLIVVDQFEELFRYQHYEGRQEAEAFVGLIVESARLQNFPIYVTLTMRSEFLGACALFGGLAEAMNDGQYLTPRMSRQQCREAIEGPAGVCGFKIEPALVNRLLNDLSDFAPWDDMEVQTMSSQLDRMVRRADQLPLLQHALNRLWVKADATGGDVVLQLNDYEAMGGLRGALNQHAREITSTLGAHRAAAVEGVFRALTVGSSIADAVRRPTKLGELIEITGATRGDVIAVCEAFRAHGRNFLTPSPPRPLRDGTIVDISHESLIRQWSELSGWLEKEARDADAMRRLGGAATRAEAESEAGDLLQGRELQSLSAWRTDSEATERWAKRYVAKPSAAFDFLNRSLMAEERRKRNLAAAEKLQARARRVRFGLVAVLTAFVVIIATYSAFQNIKADQLQAKTRELEARTSELEVARRDTERKNAELQTLNDALNKTKTDLTIAQQQLQANLADTVTTVQSFVGGTIDKQQIGGDLVSSGDLLAALTNTLRTADALPLHLVDRLAWQVAANNAGISPADDARATGTKMKRVLPADSPTQRPPFALWRNRDSDGTISVVDALSGRTVDHFTFDALTIGEQTNQGDHFLSLDGRHALLIGDEGRLYRWSAGDKEARRVLDGRWTKSRTLQSAAFDPANGDIAVLYSEFKTEFLTVIPPQKAFVAASWPIHRIAEARKDATITSYTFDLLAVHDGEPILKFMGDEGTALIRFQPTTQEAMNLMDPTRIWSARATTDLNLLRIDAKTSVAECSAGMLDLLRPNPDLVPDSTFNCEVDFDLRSGSAVARPRLWPNLGPWQSTPEPFGSQAGETRISAEQRPLWIVVSAPTAAASVKDGDVSALTRWKRSTFDFKDEQSLTSIVADAGIKLASPTDGGFRVYDVTATLTAGENGGLAKPDLIEATPQAGLSGATIDGAGMLAAGFVKDKLMANQFSEKNQWMEVALGGDPRCLERIRRGVRLKKPDEISSSNVIGSSPGFRLAAATSAGNSFLILLANKTVAWIDISQSADAQKSLRGNAICIAGVSGDAVVAQDFDRGNTLLEDKQSRKLHVLRWSSSQLVRTVALAQSEILRGATFVGSNLLVVATESDRLLAYDLSEPAKAAVELANPLPGAAAIFSRGQDLVLVRDEHAKTGSTDQDSDWSSAVIVSIDASGVRSVPKFAGFLPVALRKILAFRLADQQGGVELMSDEHTIRLVLPAVSAQADLIAAVSATGDRTALDPADESILALLASAMPDQDPGDTQITSSPYLRCAALLERANLSWIGGDAPAALIDEVRQSCVGFASSWRTPQAALDLMAAKSGDQAEASWPIEASVLLRESVQGDVTAFRILISQGKSMDSGTLVGDSARMLFSRFFEPSQATGETASAPEEFVRYAESAVGSADPYIHRALAHAAMTGEPNLDRRAKAFRHYWLAEKLFNSSQDWNAAGAMKRRRLEVAAQLPRARLVTAMAEVTSWAASPPAYDAIDPPADFDARLKSDVDLLDQLIGELGNASGFDLVKLHLLRLQRESSTTNETSLHQEISDILLSRTDWPSVDVTGYHELPMIFEQTAMAIPEANWQLKLKLTLATIRLLEFADKPIDLTSAYEDGPGSIYRRALRSAVEAGREKLEAVAHGFKFGRRSLSFGTVRLENTDALSLIRKVLEDRIKLSDMFKDNQDAQIARDTTKYWLGLTLDQTILNNALLSKVDKETLENMRNRLYRESISGLDSVAPEVLRDRSDDLYVFVKAVAFALSDGLFELKSANDQLPDVLERAWLVAKELDGLAEQGQWYSVSGKPFVDILEGLAANIARLNDVIPEPPFAESDPAVERLHMRSLRFSAEWARLLVRGGQSSEDDEHLRNGISASAGYVVAYIAGRENRREHPLGPSEFTDCDRLTAHAGDPHRRSPGLPFKDIKVANGSAECQKAHEGNEKDLTALYQFARVLSADQFRAQRSKVYALLIKAAEANYAIAFNNLRGQADEDDVSTKIQRTLIEAYKQRVFLDHFQVAYDGFRSLPDDIRDDDAIRWIAERSAQLGLPAANLALAQLETDPVERKFRMLVAEKLLRSGNKVAEADRVKAQTSGIALSAGDDQLADEKAKAFVPEPLIELTQEIRDALVPTR